MCAYVNQERFNNKGWTRECQGITTNGEYWYVSSNNPESRGVYRFSGAMRQPKYVDLSASGSAHLGDIDYFDGNIYCAMERPQRLIILPVSAFAAKRPMLSMFTLTGRKQKASPQGEKMPWCAVHPENKRLYSSRFGKKGEMVDTIFAYEKLDAATYRHEPKMDISLNRKVALIQGGCFTAESLILASDHTDDLLFFKLSTVDGKIKGTLVKREKIPKNPKCHEEVEGVAIWRDHLYKGKKSNCHVILLDNDAFNRDDIFFKHYLADEAHL